MNVNPLEYFARFIETETGIVFSETNYFQLKNRLDSIAVKLSLNNADTLYESAKAGIGPELRKLLIDAATNNETYFFRDPKIFETIDKFILPEILKRSPNERIRIWSAACSNGQEAYSVGILINELKRKPVASAEIIATDIAEKTVAKGKSGTYSKLEIERGLSPELRSRYFEPLDGEKWKVKAELASLVQFKQQNLLNPFDTLGKFDLILCRNVLIYQRVENKSKIIKSIVRNMNPGAYLILGAGESLIGVTDELRQVNLGGTFLYQS